MKNLIFLLFISSSFLGFSQNEKISGKEQRAQYERGIPTFWNKELRKAQNTYTLLPRVLFTDTLLPSEAIIYGRFFRKKGGGKMYKHSIRIINIETKKKYTFIIKRKSQKKKSNIFTCRVPPGTYKIDNYRYRLDNGVFIGIGVDPVVSNLNIYGYGVQRKMNAGEIKLEDLERFQFTVEPNTMNFVGEWHFDVGPPTMTDNKGVIETVMKKYYRFLNFSQAITNLPR